MGTKYEAIMCVGVPYKKIVKENCIDVPIRKYNRDTGEPIDYIDEQLVGYTLFDSIEIKDDELMSFMDNNKLELINLVGGGLIIIGQTIESLDQWDEIDGKEVPEEKIKKAMKETKDSLRKLNCSIEPKIYLILEVG